MTFTVGMKAEFDASDVARGAAEAKDALGGLGATAQAAGVQVDGALGGRTVAAAQLAQHELTNLTFQLNDIATGLVSGQSPFTVMAQQGLQVSQILGRRGLRDLIPAIGAGIASMINPATLALAGITALGYGVSALFDAMGDGGRAAETTLKEHVQLIRDVTDEWGAAVPALKAYLDELDQAERKKNLATAGENTVANIWENARDKVREFDGDVRQLSDSLGLYGVDAAQLGAELSQAWEDLAFKIKDGTARSSDANQVLQLLNRVLEQGGPLAQSLAADMQTLADTLNTVAFEAGNVARDVEKALNPTLTARTAEAIELRNIMRATEVFISGQERRNGLTRDQLALENEIARVKSDAARTGAQLTTEQATRLAEDALAAEKRRTPARATRTSPSEKLLLSSSEDIARLRLELSLIGATAAQRERANALLEAEIAIKRAKIAVDSQAAETIRAEQLAMADMRLQIERQADAWNTVKSAGEGAIDGVSAALKKGDFAGALNAITDSLLDTVTKLGFENPLKNLLYGENLATLGDTNASGGLLGMFFGRGRPTDSSIASSISQVTGTMTVQAASVIINGGVAGGGLAGGLGGLGSLFGGGSADPWAGLRSTGSTSSAGGFLGGLLSLFGFDGGGWTGSGNPRRVAGYVHEEEFVVRAGPAKRFRPMLESINSGRGGYDQGGFVDASARPAGFGGGGWGRSAGNVFIKVEDHAGVSVGQRRESSADGDDMITLVLDRVDGAIADGSFDGSLRRYSGGQVRDAEMIPVWPAGLPQYVLRSGFVEKPSWPRYSFPAEAGLPIDGPMATVDLRNLECACVMSADQVEIFEDFVFRDLGQGSLPFEGPHPRTRAAWLLKFAGNPSPFEIRSRTAREWTVAFALIALGEAG